MSRQETLPDKTVPAKIRHRETMLGFLSNPDNTFVTRKHLAIEVLGLNQASSLYRLFSPNELSEIELEGLELRRKRYASKLAAVDDALLKRAASKEGTSADAKLAFQRYEQWSEKTKQEITIDGPMLQQILAVFPPEIAEQVKAALIQRHRELT